MKNLQLTDSEFLLLHDLLDSMLADSLLNIALKVKERTISQIRWKNKT
ncbi:hypothetical protein ES708_30719 [subsurface metagenome]